jgi:hypothetical protein
MKYRQIAIWRAFLPKGVFSHPPLPYPPVITAGPTPLVPFRKKKIHTRTAPARAVSRRGLLLHLGNALAGCPSADRHLRLVLLLQFLACL